MVNQTSREGCLSRLPRSDRGGASRREAFLALDEDSCPERTPGSENPARARRDKFRGAATRHLRRKRPEGSPADEAGGGDVSS